MTKISENGGNCVFHDEACSNNAPQDETFPKHTPFIADINDEPPKYTLEAINQLSVTLSNQYKAMKPVIKIGEAVFAVNGDISFVSGVPKAGKSTITRVMIATALMSDVPPDCDTISMRTEFCQGRKVIYLDTEQNPADTQKMISSILGIAGLEKQPENFIALNLREFSHAENMDYLESLFYHHRDAYLWIIDGVTDFLPSANDETSGNILIRYLMKMSSLYDTCIVCLIHENSGNGNGKMRGHIGSEAARKCQGAISISYEEHAKVHSIKSTHFRGSKKIDPIYWKFNESGRPISCDAEETLKINTSENADQKKTSEMIRILDLAYKNVPEKGLTIDELKIKIDLHMEKKSNVKKDSLRTARDRIYKGMIDQYLISTEKDTIEGVERTVHYYNNPKGGNLDL